MSSLKYALAGAALFCSVGDAASEGPALQTSSMKGVSVTGLEGSPIQNFFLEETVSSDRSTVRWRAYVDRDIGVICEWVERGRSEADAEAQFHIVGRKGEAIGCIQSVDVPKTWGNVISNGFSLQSEVTQDPKNISVVHDLLTSRDEEGRIQFQIRHSWDIAAGKVCLKTAELLEDEVGDQEIFAHDWGCFEIRNTKLLDEILKSAGIVPA